MRFPRVIISAHPRHVERWARARARRYLADNRHHGDTFARRHQLARSSLVISRRGKKSRSRAIPNHRPYGGSRCVPGLSKDKSMLLNPPTYPPLPRRTPGAPVLRTPCNMSSPVGFLLRFCGYTAARVFLSDKGSPFNECTVNRDRR